MAVLVTGGAGYIGSHMVLDLVDAGEEVVVIDDLRNSDHTTVPDTVPLLRGDVANRTLVRDTLRDFGCTAIIHFAGSTVVPESVEKPGLYYSNNSAASLALIETACEVGVRHFVFSSTAAVYGTVGADPVPETHEPRPESPYGRSKLMTEIMLRDVATTGALSFAALRYFNVAGADPRGRTGQSTPRATYLIKVACQTALGQRTHLDIFGDNYSTPDGTGVRDFVHVSDLSNAHLLALRHLQSGGQSLVANCGYGRGFSVRDVISCVEQATGIPLNVRTARPRAGDLASVVADSAILREILGWTPKYDDLKTIVQTAFDWESRIAQQAAQPIEPLSPPTLDWSDLDAVETSLEAARTVSRSSWLQLIAARPSGTDAGDFHFQRIAGKALHRLDGDAEALAQIMAMAIDRRALRFASKTLALVPPADRSSRAVALQTARLHYELDDAATCLATVENILESPSALERGLQLGALAKLGRYAEAFRIVSDGIPNPKDIDWAFTKLFTSYGVSGETEAGVDAALDAVVAAAPEPKAATRVRLLSLVGRDDEAVTLAGQLVHDHGTEAECIGIAADAFLRANLWAEGRGVLARAVDLLPAKNTIALGASTALAALQALDRFYAAAPEVIARDYRLPDAMFEYLYHDQGEWGQRCTNADPAEFDVAMIGATMAAGGAERILLNAYIGLRDRATGPRHELWLYSTDRAWGHDHYLLEYGIDPDAAQDIRRLPRPDRLPEGYDWLPPDTGANAYRIRQAIQARRPRILHAWQDTTNLEAAIAGIEAGVSKIVLHPHNLQPDLVHKIPLAPAFRRSYKALLRRPDVDLVCCSRASLDAYMDWLEMTPNDRCHVVHNGMQWASSAPGSEQHALERAAIRRKYRLPEDAFVVAGAFRLVDLKRPLLWLETAIATVANDPNIYFLLLGDGPRLTEMKEKIARLGLSRRIIFGGQVMDMAGHYAGADLLLHTSESEALPSVVIEALAGALPVVASDVGGTRECAVADPSMLTPVQDDRPNSYVTAVLRVKANRPSPAVKSKVRAETRAYFSIERMIDQFSAVYGLTQT